MKIMWWNVGCLAIMCLIEPGVSNLAKLRNKRQALTEASNRLWPNKEIPFYFPPEYPDGTSKDRIREAFLAVEDNTCLTFPELDATSAASTSAFLNLQPDIQCYSIYGKSADQPQDLIIASNAGCRPQAMIGKIFHEIFHALGVFHTMARFDREDHITVVEGNIRTDITITDYNVKDESVASTYGLPYDYNSMMHYKNNTFAGTDPATGLQYETVFTPVDPIYSYGFGIGLFTGPSFDDYKLLNLMYCSDEITDCSRGGYQLPGKECACPLGFGPPNCTVVATANQPDKCPKTGELMATDTEQCIEVTTIEALDYKCDWHIKSTTCEISVDIDVDLFNWAPANVGLQYLEVKHKNLDQGAPGARFTDAVPPSAKPLISEGNEIMISLRTPKLKASGGFKFCYKLSDTCPTTTTTAGPTTTTTTAEPTTTTTTAEPTTTTTTAEPTTTTTTAEPTTTTTTAEPTTTTTTAEPTTTTTTAEPTTTTETAEPTTTTESSGSGKSKNGKSKNSKSKNGKSKNGKSKNGKSKNGKSKNGKSKNG